MACRLSGMRLQDLMTSVVQLRCALALAGLILMLIAGMTWLDAF